MTPENEEKKAYLMRYKWGQKRIEEIETEITQLRLSALPGAITYDGMPKGSCSTADMSGYAAKLDALIEKHKAVRKKLLDELSEIDEAIDAVEEPMYNILLRYRYICMKDWDEIADIMHYTTRHITRVHGKALEAFQMPQSMN